ncbi:MAG TPA: hypothetical protein VN973_07430 [Candidatus Dormibacteraeota bacterium]|nr:hypothetical protein [Candidatus Dormibacteraeota bacterium]
MITTIVTFLSTRIVSVVITSVVVVAAVPTLIVAIHGNTITITTAVASAGRTSDDQEHARIVVEVKSAGDAVVVKLNNEEAACDSQIAQLAAKSNLSATATAAELKKGKDDFHASLLPFENEIKADEDELDHLKVITTQTEQTFLVRINEVQVIALGENGQAGTLVTVCQTIIVQITQVIVIVQPAPSSGGDEGDIKKAAA